MKTILRILLLYFGTLLSPLVYGTAQIPDILIYQGKKYNLNSNPLEPYFELHPDKRPQEGFSTALWRGYIATFEITDNKLYLIDISILASKDSLGKYIHYRKSVKDQVFPGQEKIVIDWFTGLLVVPDGRLKHYVHMGYASTYSKYILIELNKGLFIQERRFNAREYNRFRHEQFLAFKQTDEYKKIFDELSKDKNNTAEFIDSFLEIYVTEYTTKILTDSKK
jgi:hypothetical protein